MFSNLVFRTGANHGKIPINRPLVATNTPTQRDGLNVYDDNQDGKPNYLPSSYTNSYMDPRYKEQPFVVEGSILVQRYNKSSDYDYIQVLHTPLFGK